MAQKPLVRWTPIIATFISAAIFWAILGGLIWGWDRMFLWALLGALIFTAGELLRQLLQSSRIRPSR